MSYVQCFETILVPTPRKEKKLETHRKQAEHPFFLEDASTHNLPCKRSLQRAWAGVVCSSKC